MDRLINKKYEKSDEKLKNNLRKEHNIKKTAKLLVSIGLTNFIIMTTGIYVNNPREYLNYARDYLYYLKKNHALKQMKKI